MIEKNAISAPYEPGFISESRAWRCSGCGSLLPPVLDQPNYRANNWLQTEKVASFIKIYILENYMPFTSAKDYWTFRDDVLKNFRYQHSDQTKAFLETVRETVHHRQAEYPEGSVFYRAQAGCTVEGGKDNGLITYSPYSQERMKPLRNSANEGRVNPKGIPCLYMATEFSGAVAEIRPAVGSRLSVAKMVLSKNLKLVNCTAPYPGPTMKETYFPPSDPDDIEAFNWGHIDNAFSEIVSGADNLAEYAPTQILSELFKHEGFDGICYKSSYDISSLNIALFNMDDAQVEKVKIVKVHNQKFKLETLEGKEMFIPPSGLIFSLVPSSLAQVETSSSPGSCRTSSEPTSMPTPSMKRTK